MVVRSAVASDMTPSPSTSPVAMRMTVCWGAPRLSTKYPATRAPTSRGMLQLAVTYMPMEKAVGEGR